MEVASVSSSCCCSNEQLSTELTIKDRIGSWKARWNIGRMNYIVKPGLYKIGRPDDASPVLVTANYKMTVDALRKELAGRDLWILVLDTKGVNVWCAAGKGTFGTDELLIRIAAEHLSDVISHKVIILPQLSAPGISAHKVKKLSGFKVVYGPVRAGDIPYFLDNGMTAAPLMRKVRSTFYDRLILTPVELVQAFGIMLKVFGVMALLNCLGLLPVTRIDYLGLLGAVLSGAFVTPLFLPWIPGRAFAWKGFIIGLVWAIGVTLFSSLYYEHNIAQIFSYILIFPAVSAFFAMNFTGSSTYTSLSGVIKEMKFAVPLIITGLVIGTVSRCISFFNV